MSLYNFEFQKCFKLTFKSFKDDHKSCNQENTSRKFTYSCLYLINLKSIFEKCDHLSKRQLIKLFM